MFRLFKRNLPPRRIHHPTHNDLLATLINYVNNNYSFSKLRKILAILSFEECAKYITVTLPPTFLSPVPTLLDLKTRFSNRFMQLGFRFFPDYNSVLLKKALKLPITTSYLIEMKKWLGLSLSREGLNTLTVQKLNMDLLTTTQSRIFLEAITFHNGFYGRFLIVVQFGIGLTILHGFCPTSSILDFVNPVFDPAFEDLSSFFSDPDMYVLRGFDKHTFAMPDSINNTQLDSTYKDVLPFKDIKIPDTVPDSNLQSVQIALAVVIFLTLGVAPYSDSLFTYSLPPL